MLQVGGIWRGGIDRYDDRWSAEAAVDPIRAAISVRGVEAEARKSAADIEMVLKEAVDGVLLDLGCGYGRIAKYALAVRQFDGYVGQDGSMTMLHLFFDRYQGNELEQRTPLMLIHGRIDHVRLPDASVDNVLITAVLLHNSKRVARLVLNEAWRVLRPGGKLLVLSDLPNSRTVAALPGRVYLSLLMLRGRREQNGPIRYYSRRQVQRLFADFDDVTIHAKGLVILPKHLRGMPVEFNRWYRRAIHDSVQRFAARRFPARLQGWFYGNVSVVATKS